MTLKEVSAEQLAAAFHNHHEALGPDFERGIATENHSWTEVPPAERERMIEAARLALLEIDGANPTNNDRRRWFAQPGLAEWGC